jgi:hypothetical protein
MAPSKHSLVLPDTISSPQDLLALTIDVRAYARWFSHNTIKAKASAARGSQAPQVSPVTIELIRNWTGQALLTQDSLDELIAALEHFRDTAPTLTITLAAPAGGELKKTLVAWCRANIAPNALVSFRFNATLLGGMVVRYGSRVFDWSFRREIIANRSKFAEVLRNV